MEEYILDEELRNDLLEFLHRYLSSHVNDHVLDMYKTLCDLKPIGIE